MVPHTIAVVVNEYSTVLLHKCGRHFDAWRVSVSCNFTAPHDERQLSVWIGS